MVRRRALPPAPAKYRARSEDKSYVLPMEASHVAAGASVGDPRFCSTPERHLGIDMPIALDGKRTSSKFQAMPLGRYLR
jgi:hypothetical protein